MSRLGDERAALLAALEAGGVRVATSGQLTAPCVLLEPGDPWTEPVRAAPGGRVGRWRITAIAGAADTEAGVLELAELVELVDASLRSLEGGPQLPSWAGPAVRELDDGVRRRSSIATIRYASS